jgi:Xaa-Pro dipeptidase
LNTAFEQASPGITEKELRARAVEAMLMAGADGAKVALTSGPRSGLKHAEPTDRPIEEGDMLFVDVGAPCQGYMSDVARTGVVGVADDQKRKMLETALEMRDKVVEAVKPGARICDLQLIAENVAAKHGFADYYYPTGFGHGIGTSVVESPILFPDSEAQLEENMVFSLEPMIVIEGVGTAVFEDMILVTSDGGESLSDATTSTW